MRILFVSRYYHPFVGGIETQTRLMAHHLANRHDVGVACSSFRTVDIPFGFRVLGDSLLLPAPEDYDDGPVHATALGATARDRLRMAPAALRATPWPRQYGYDRLRRLGYRAFRSAYVPKLRELVRGCDVVHAVTNEYLGWAAQEAARAEGVPFVVTPYVHPGQHAHRGQGLGFGGFGGDDPANVAYYRRSDAVFALLETDRDTLVDLGVPADKVRLSGVVPLLPPSADPAGFRARHGIGDRPVVLYVGRMEEYKGARALVRAAPQVWQRSPDTHFLFVGPARPQQLAWLGDGAGGRLRHLGLLSEQEKADALAACDVFAMPSKFEILPAVYLEAWSYGRPVLGGSAFGLRELIEGNGGGYTVEQEPDEIAAHLGRLLADVQLRHHMGERGRQLVRERFSEEALARSFEDAYEQLAVHA